MIDTKKLRELADEHLTCYSIRTGEHIPVETILELLGRLEKLEHDNENLTKENSELYWLLNEERYENVKQAERGE